MAEILTLEKIGAYELAAALKRTQAVGFEATRA